MKRLILISLAVFIASGPVLAEECWKAFWNLGVVPAAPDFQFRKLVMSNANLYRGEGQTIQLSSDQVVQRVPSVLTKIRTAIGLLPTGFTLDSCTFQLPKSLDDGSYSVDVMVNQGRFYRTIRLTPEEEQQLFPNSCRH